MNKKSFPTITGLSAKGISFTTRQTVMNRPLPKTWEKVVESEYKSDEDDKPYMIPSELICPRCKSSASTDDKFCTRCGEPLFWN